MKHYLQRALSMCLAVLMLVTAVSVPIFADAGVTGASNAENSSESIYDSVGYSQKNAEEARSKVDLTTVPTLTGVTSPTESVYKIDSLDAYRNFVSLVNSGNTFSEKTVYLACNLDLSKCNEAQMPIGFSTGTVSTNGEEKLVFNQTAYAKFSGTIDGLGYAITGICIEQTLADTRYSAFIGWAVNATVKNVILSGKVTHLRGTFTGKADFTGTGGLFACADTCTVDNVYCDIDVIGVLQSAGFVARGGAEITDSTNAGDIVGTAAGGGFFGFSGGTISAENCLNTGHVEAEKAGGIMARGRSSTTLKNCVNSGSVAASAKGYAGGIVGVTDSTSAKISVTDCTNCGYVVARDGTAHNIGTQVSGTLTIDANTVSEPYIGYSADGFYTPDLSGVANINTVTTLSSSVTAYQITDGNGLLKLAELVRDGNNFKNVTVYLANDIDLSGLTFLPIGQYYNNVKNEKVEKPFSGTFDGLGHTIRNLTYQIDTETECGYGLFGYLKDATISNLVLDSSCSFTDTINSGYTGMGAIVGNSTGSTKLQNLCNYASVSSFGHGGGMVGRGSVAEMTNCENHGTITAKNSAGGLTAFRVGGDITRCVNYGSVTGNIAGGVISRCASHGKTYQYLQNYGTVIGTANAGGIIGAVGGTTKVDDVSTDITVTLNECINYATVVGSKESALVAPMYTKEGTFDPTVNTLNCANLVKSGYDAEWIEDSALPAYDLKHYDEMALQTAYVISDAEGLLKLAELVNGGTSFAGITVYLNADLNLFGQSLQPIGTASNAFRGTFDGRGHTISALTMRIDSSVDGSPAYVALFGYGKNATVKNLILDSTCSFVQTKKDGAERGSTAAVMACGDNCTLSNVKTQATVTGALHAAGLGGRGSISADHCTNTGSVTGVNSAGGILAYATSNVFFCANYGDVTATGAECGKAGGITARQEVADTQYAWNENYGLVTADYLAGGILGVIRRDCCIWNCTNYGTAAPVTGYDCATSGRYNIESGYSPALTCSGISDLSNIGYSASISEAEKVDLDLLLQHGLAKNIEDYNHAEDYLTVNYLIIDSAEDLRIFAQLINGSTRGEINGVKKTFYLACDIDMSGYTFTGDRLMTEAGTFAPIGWDQVTKDGVLTNTSVAKNGKSMYFTGIFDGQGHTISGLSMQSDSNENTFLGLFGYLNGATVKNLILGDDCSISASHSSYQSKAGMLAGGAENSTVRNVWTQGALLGTGDQVAGMIGRPSGVTFIGCTNSATVSGSGSVGGFSGFGASVRCYSCRNTGTVSGNGYAGGFAGRDRGKGTYIQCVNIANITATNFAGAVAGCKDDKSTTNYAYCQNFGAIVCNTKQTGLLFGGTGSSNAIFEKLTKVNFNNSDAYHIAQMLDTKYQIRSNGDGTFDLRMISSVDSLSYLSAGFLVTVADQGSVTLSTTTVYSSILASNGEEEITYLPSEKFADTSKYFITYTISNVPDAYMDQLGTDTFTMQGFLITNNNDAWGYRKVDPIDVENRYQANITTSIGTIGNFKTPQSYTLPDSDITVKLQYQAWPSVCVDENGTIYAFISGRLEHTDPFGHHLMYTSTDGGATWSDPITINDSPMDDRDIGITYLGGGRMLATYFRIGVVNYMTKGDTITTKDGQTLTGLGTYTGWMNNVNIGSTAAERAEVYKKIKAYWSGMDAADLNGGCWTISSQDYGKNWSNPINAPVTTPHGAIQLSGGEILYVGRDGSRIKAYTSYDNGYTWEFNSTVYDNSSLTGQYSNLTFCEPHVTELQNGRWLVAIRIEANTSNLKSLLNTTRNYGAFFDETTDELLYKWGPTENGQTVWYYYRLVIHEDGTAEMVEHETYNNSNHPKNTTGYRIFTVYSDDQGATWSQPEVVRAASLVDGSLPTYQNAVYGTPPHLTQMEDGTVVMVYATRSGSIGERALLSYDGGETWSDEILLCNKPYDNAAGTGYIGSDIGYPATVYLGNGEFVTVYYQAASGDKYCSFLYTKWSLTKTN